MKTIRIFCVIFLIYSLMSCQSKKENSNIVLTDFTKELISLYINDVGSINAKNRKDEIIIISSNDTLYYYLSVYSNNNKSHSSCREDFVGQTLYSGHLVRVFGNKNSNFYSVNEKIKVQRRQCKDNYPEYDPFVWRVCFYKDFSFNKMRTYNGNVDISAIQNLAEKYFSVADTAHKSSDSEVYQWYEVENPPKFLLGEDSLRHLISSNFRIKRDDIQDKIPVFVTLIIDKSGKTTLGGVTKSSNDAEIDNEALRVAKIVCQYDFVPASHRGEKVNAIFPVAFLRNDIVHSN